MKYALWMVAGAILSRILEPIVFPIEVGSFRIHLGNVAYVLLAISVARLYRGRMSRTLWLALGIAFDQMTFILVHNQAELGFYSIPSVVGSLSLLSLAGLTFLAMHLFRVRCEDSVRFLLLSERVTVALGIGVVIAAYRVPLTLLRISAVSNDSRSLFVAGFEIHHVNAGVLMVWLASSLLLVTVRQSRSRFVAYLVLTIGLGTVVDQISYSALAELTDATYFGRQSLYGAVALYLGLAVTLLLPQRMGGIHSAV